MGTAAAGRGCSCGRDSPCGLAAAAPMGVFTWPEVRSRTDSTKAATGLYATLAASQATAPTTAPVAASVTAPATESEARSSPPPVYLTRGDSGPFSRTPR